MRTSFKLERTSPSRVARRSSASPDAISSPRQRLQRHASLRRCQIYSLLFIEHRHRESVVVSIRGPVGVSSSVVGNVVGAPDEVEPILENVKKSPDGASRDLAAARGVEAVTPLLKQILEVFPLHPCSHSTHYIGQVHSSRVSQRCSMSWPSRTSGRSNTTPRLAQPPSRVPSMRDKV
ncbi:hypothetical protein EXIGLDRAFT_492474 [Exidia glandulosa HHB12029]|uniref:Uncharacterized protein n=1 Tax=Exidia glandulosa HHB12029 TaxID=1314781 RepID=A0A165JLJ1_EXIGL|nr:hypothetical protein EXIGLDRAFT_492474 [Exidia glandulosa HHB12029]